MLTTLKKRLLEWHNPAKRAMPWKENNRPYNIWLSEIMLQQTRVEQGTPYFLNFIEKYPNVYALSAAPIDDVLKTWEGLGYYSRARNLHEAAKQVVNEFNGNFPNDYDSILRLKGVGPYTAAAIASFAFDLPYAVLDGNVFRVLSRYFGVEIPIDSTEGKKYFSDLAQKCLDHSKPAAYNQAIMDFGATVCTPKNADCQNCPLSSDCKAFNGNQVYQLPVKEKKIIKQQRCFNFLVLKDSKTMLIQLRTEQDIWQGLYQFPLIESAALESHLQPSDFGIDVSGLQQLQLSPVFKQTLTHRNIVAHFIEVEMETIHSFPEKYLQVPLSAISEYAFPRIIRDYLGKFSS